MEVTPQLRDKAAEITHGAANDDDKIRTLYSFVATSHLGRR